MAFETLKRRDVALSDERHTVHETDTMAIWMAFFKDLDGNTLALASEIPKS